MSQHVHTWERFAYVGKGVAPILCTECASPMSYPPERLAIWHTDPLAAARMLDEADRRMEDFALYGGQYGKRP